VAESDTVGPSVDLSTGQNAGLIDIGSIAVDPNNSGVVYAATGDRSGRYGSGILRSTDGGSTWTFWSAGPDSRSRMPGIKAFFRHAITKIIVDPTSGGVPGHVTSNVLYLGLTQDGTGATSAALTADDGLYKSTDCGKTWTKVLMTGTLDSPIEVSDLAYTWNRPNRSFTLFVGVSASATASVGGIWRSTNGGNTWVQLARVPRVGPPFGVGAPIGDDIVRIALATVGKSGVDYILAAAVRPDGHGNVTLDHVYKSADNGASWNTIDPDDSEFHFKEQDQLSYNLAFGLSPLGIIYLGGQKKLLQGELNGTWRDITPRGKTRLHDDLQTLAFDPVQRLTVYLGTDGGLWSFNDIGGQPWSWTNLNTTGLGTIQFWGIGAGGNVIGGSQDNGYAITTDGQTWKTIEAGDGTLARFSQRNPNIVYRFAQASPDRSAQGGLPGTWTLIPVRPDGSDHFNRLAVNPDNPDVVMVGGGDEGGTVWQTHTAGSPVGFNSGWDTLLQGLGYGVVSALTYAPTYAPDGHLTWLKAAYAGFRTGRVFVTKNADKAPGPADWTQAANPWGATEVTGIAVDPNVPGDAYLTIGKFIDGGRAVAQVYRTIDWGLHWSPIGGGNLALGGLPNLPAHAIAVDPNPNGGYPSLYVGNDVGVYQAVYGPAPGMPGTNQWNWTRFGTGLPNVQVQDMSLQASGNNRQLVVGTFGRSAWSIPLPPWPKAGGGGGGGGIGAIERRSGTFVIATFADTGGTGNYQVSINWGDGSALDTTSGTVTGSGTLTVSGTHAFADDGMYTVTATITRTGGSSVVLTTPANVVDAALTANTPPSINGTAFTAIPNQVVATFTDAAPSALVGEFTANVAWGDGSNSPGTISVNGNTISVSSGHTYTSAGSFPVVVNLYDVGGSSATSSSTATITGSITSQAVAVTDAEGAVANVVVATFTDPSPGSYTAVINWGDGNVSAGTVQNTGGNNYSVTGSNTYEEEGLYPIAVTITRNGTSAAIVYGAAAVGDAPLTPTGLTLSATQGVTLSDVVARFMDANLNAPLSDFTATIDWGDGTTLGDGSLPVGTVQTEGPGAYAVSGSHTYLIPGTYTVLVTLWDVGGSFATATSTVTVQGAPPTVTAVDPNWGPPAGGTVVTIYGTNLNDATAVTFGSTAATSFNINPDGSITAVAPAEPVGTVDITVTNPYGTSATSSADQFTYVSGSPTVTAVTPVSGPTGGGTTVTITGTNLAGATQVNFGSTPATFTGSPPLPSVPPRLVGPREPWTSQSSRLTAPLRLPERTTTPTRARRQAWFRSAHPRDLLREGPSSIFTAPTSTTRRKFPSAASQPHPSPSSGPRPSRR
jgi:hypothetical protein